MPDATATRIIVQNTTGPSTVDALAFGSWAAHRSTGGEGRWSVTYIPHGKRAANDLNKREALKLASILNERVPNLRWSGKDDELPHADDLIIAKAAVREIRGW